MSDLFLDLEQMEIAGLKFFGRKGSSDFKAVREVVEKNSYRRKGFELIGERSWVDLGANIGAFTCLVARRFAETGLKVHAFEPDPMNFELLKLNVETNQLQDGVELFHQAVVAGSGKGHATLSVNSARGNFWRNSLHKQWRGGNLVEVETVGLDDVLKRAAGFDIKMDVEGAEMPLIESMRSRPALRMVFEWSFDIDNSIPRFKQAIEKLKGFYASVQYSKFDETQEQWGASWFPPCRTVWCQ